MSAQNQKYTLEEVPQDGMRKWDRFVDESAEGTLFHQSRFLDSFNGCFKYFYVSKGNETHAGVVVSVSLLEPRRLTFVPGVIHNGVLFKAGLIAGGNPARLNSVHFDILEFVAQELPRRYDSVRLRLTPSIVDVRPFQWFNYGSHEAGDKYRIDVRFTSFLPLTAFESTEDLAANHAFRALSYSRRQEIRCALRDGMTVDRGGDVQTFIDLYCDMSSSYDPDAVDFANQLDACVRRLRQDEAAELYLARNREGQVAAGVIMGLDSKRGYYLYGASSKSARERYSGSFVLWEAIRDLHKRRGVQELDLEGINSPQRGYFKLSFGGDIRPYFELAWDKRERT